MIILSLRKVPWDKTYERIFFNIKQETHDINVRIVMIIIISVRIEF